VDPFDPPSVIGGKGKKGRANQGGRKREGLVMAGTGRGKKKDNHRRERKEKEGKRQGTSFPLLRVSRPAGSAKEKGKKAAEKEEGGGSAMLPSPLYLTHQHTVKVKKRGEEEGEEKLRKKGRRGDVPASRADFCWPFCFLGEKRKKKEGGGEGFKRGGGK